MIAVGNPTAPVYAIAAEFPCAGTLYRAVETIRNAGYEKWDVFSPFPIQGLDALMGFKPSMLGKIVFLGGLVGFLASLALVCGPTFFLFPVLVAGMPNSLATAPALLPVVVVLTLLLSAVTTGLGLFALTGLPRLNHPIFNWKRFRLATEDKFFVAIESGDPKFSSRSVCDLLAVLGATHITTIHGD
jgi:hypothetical protein